MHSKISKKLILHKCFYAHAIQTLCHLFYHYRIFFDLMNTRQNVISNIDFRYRATQKQKYISCDYFVVNTHIYVHNKIDCMLLNIMRIFGC